MTRHGSFKKVVRRHAHETGQRYTEALTALEGVEARLHHRPDAELLRAHLRDRYGIDAVAATKASQHNDHVFRVDRRDGDPWIARVFPPSRPQMGVEGDAAILRFLEQQGYPAERLPVDDAVSGFDGARVLVTGFVDGGKLPDGAEKIAMLGDLLGRLHALEPDDQVSRPGGAAGDDPTREGSPRQDLMAALSFLDAVATKVAPAHRQRFEQLRDHVASADDGHGLPEALLHGNLLHDPDHALLTGQGPVAINWKAAGRGPRLADLAYLLWGAAWLEGDGVGAAVEAYRRHVELSDDELDRLEAVMCIRPLYLACFDYRRSLAGGLQPTGSEWWWSLVDPRAHHGSRSRGPSRTPPLWIARRDVAGAAGIVHHDLARRVARRRGPVVACVVAPRHRLGHRRPPPPTRRVLLRWHPGLGFWNHVGGHAAGGERDPYVTARRESIEETGLLQVALPTERTKSALLGT